MLWVNEVSKTLGALCTFALILGYPYVVALLFGYKTMPPMDQCCFVSSSKANVNFCSVSFFEGNFDEEWLKGKFAEMVSRLPKLRYRPVMLGGDLYY